MASATAKTLAPMPVSQDHKRLQDGDQGPNTGGMGAYAPAPCVTPALFERIDREILKPFLKGIQGEGFDLPRHHLLRMMLTTEGPKLLDFNVRFAIPKLKSYCAARGRIWSTFWSDCSGSLSH